LYTLRFSGILWIRLLATSLVHGSCGSLVAQGIYKGKRCFFLVCAVAIHGLYNMFVELSLFPSAIPVLFAVLIFFVFWAPLIEKAKKG
ncbi:MAG: hypothetical protein N2Z76_05780, partial [Treponemataceae bacterium]|nr:hypothetical protein [Treponemataceae bacterium]